MRKRLAVDAVSDDKTRETTIYNLRRMVKYGKMAERALRDIKAQGFAHGTFPTVGSPIRNSYGNRHQVSNVVEVRLKAYVDPVRELAPPLSDLGIYFGNVETSYNGGAEFEQLPLIVRGQIFRQRRDEHVIEDGSIPFGYLRLLKNGYSFEQRRTAPGPEEEMVHMTGTGSVFQVYSNFKYDGAQKMLKGFAAAISWAVVRTAKGTEADQLTTDMEKAVEGWLMSEGHVHRMCEEMHRHLTVREVQSR